MYITSDLGLVGEGMIEQDLDGQVNIQTLPLEIDTEVSHQKEDNGTEQ